MAGEQTTDPGAALADALALAGVTTDADEAARVLRHLRDLGWAVRRAVPVVNPVILEGTTARSGIHVRLEQGAARNLLKATIDGVEVKVVGHTTFRDGGTQHIQLEGGGRIHISSPMRAGGPPTYNGEPIQ